MCVVVVHCCWLLSFHWSWHEFKVYEIRFVSSASANLKTSLFKRLRTEQSFYEMISSTREHEEKSTQKFRTWERENSLNMCQVKWNFNTPYIWAVSGEYANKIYIVCTSFLDNVEFHLSQSWVWLFNFPSSSTFFRAQAEITSNKSSKSSPKFVLSQWQPDLNREDSLCRHPSQVYSHSS